MKALVLAALLSVSGGPNLADMTLVDVQTGLCPDGSVISAEIYSPNPDPDSLVVVWNRGERTVGVLTKPSNMLWVAQAKKEIPLDEAMQKWPSPCDLPDPGIGT